MAEVDNHRAASGVKGVRDIVHGQVCELCGAFENLRLCGRCGERSYCSKEHQKQDWKTHKSQCTPKVSKSQKLDSITAVPATATLTARDCNGNDSSKTSHSSGPSYPSTTTNTGFSAHPVTWDVPPPADVGLSPHPPDHRSQQNPQHTTATTIESRTPLTQQAGVCAEGSNSAGHTRGFSHDYTTSVEGGGASLASANYASSLAATHNINKNWTANISQNVVDEAIDPVLHADTSLRDESFSKTGNLSDSTSGNTLSSPENYDPNVMTITDSHEFVNPAFRSCQGNPGTDPGAPPGSTQGVGARPKNEQFQQEGNPQSVASTRPKIQGKRRLKGQNRAPEPTPASSTPSPPEETKLADYVVKMLNNYGICVVDNFMASEKAQLILDEVMNLKTLGKFQDGQTVQQGSVSRIRGDKITWVEKGDAHGENIGSLITRLDALMVSCKGRLDRYNINGRTKAMVACYPGDGSGYKRHIDNPKGDGRCITCIYYLNKGWNLESDGGLLRIFPVMFKQVADIEPKFDRLLFFWSDRRNPHEVQPAYKTRFAITVWYFDADERKKAKIQHKVQGLTESSSYQNFEVNKLD